MGGVAPELARRASQRDPPPLTGSRPSDHDDAMTDQPPPAAASVSMEEACEIFGCSADQILKLIKEGRVGYVKGQRRSRRFFREHLDQIKACLEFKPREPDIYDEIGLTHRSATIRRNRDFKRSLGIK